MNKRILDGGALWKSDKLARIQPEWMRAEYANWIPLALANGVFEADTRRIWATIYSYNRPDISHDDAEEIKREFCRVGLLFLWPDEPSGKIWGFFVGIDKAGRLPPQSRVNRKHAETGPVPPTDALCSYIELTRAKPVESSVASQWLANGCLGSGSGSGLGSGSNTNAPSAQAQKPRLVRVSVNSEDATEGFSEFWTAYPRKKAKKAALRAWKKISVEDHPPIMAVIARLRSTEEWQRDRGRYIPHPATFLGGERWKDELSEAQVPEGANGLHPVSTQVSDKEAEAAGVRR